MRQLMWFRQDLRVQDNSALTAAMQQGPTIAIYLISPTQWQLHQDAPAKINFWLRNLESLAISLQQLNVPLLIEVCDTWDQAAVTLKQVCEQHAVTHVHFNQCYGVNEQRRDQAVEQLFNQQGLNCSQYQDALLFAPGSVLNQQHQPYQVFTSFKKACWSRLQYSQLPFYPIPNPQAVQPIQSTDLQALLRSLPYSQNLTDMAELWPAGEMAAWNKLSAFLEEKIENYATDRDLPALQGTSTLSPYLVAGVISVRQCFNAARRLNNGELSSGNTGITTWLTELLWREFYQHILALFPRISKGFAYQTKTESLAWNHNPEHLQAWQQGRTGFPLIDAAMRQLLATGWMHNRLRMVSAMFLSKNLLIDWRLGEQWFMQHLIDGDLAANNGGWQWSASTGTDSVPYFRVFNPVTQSQRFDPQGLFIKHWIPELAHLSAKQIHFPPTFNDDLLGKTTDYPAPIVDLKHSRIRAIEAFKALT